MSLPHSISTISFTAAILGVCSHLSYFIHGQHRNLVATYVFLLSIFPMCLRGIIAQFSVYGISQAIGITIVLRGAYLTSTLASILVYEPSFIDSENILCRPLRSLESYGTHRRLCTGI